MPPKRKVSQDVAPTPVSTAPVPPLKKPQPEPASNPAPKKPFSVVLEEYCGVKNALFQPLCQYGASCYRKNPQHRLEFRHPKDSCLMDGSTPSSIGIVAAREVTNRVMQIIQDHGGQMVNHSTTPLWLVDFDYVKRDKLSDEFCAALQNKLQLFSIDALLALDAASPVANAYDAKKILDTFALTEKQIEVLMKKGSAPFKEYRARMAMLKLPVEDLPTTGCAGASNAFPNFPLDVSNLILLALAKKLSTNVAAFLGYRSVSTNWRRAILQADIWKGLCEYWVGNRGGEGWVPSIDSVNLAQSRSNLSWPNFYLRNLLPLFLDEIRMEKIRPKSERRIGVFFDMQLVPNDAAIPIGGSHTGGAFVDLPQNMKIPGEEGCEKMFQLNLADIAHTLSSIFFGLPTQGNLYFYAQSEEYIPDTMKVGFFQGDASRLKRVPNIVDTPSSSKICRLHFYERLTIDWDGYDENEEKQFEKERESLPVYNSMFGWATSVQAPVLEELIPEAEDEGKTDRTILLCQLDSGGPLDWCFGDCGALYWVMKESDLKKAAKIPLVFEKKVKGDMQCG